MKCDSQPTERGPQPCSRENGFNFAISRVAIALGKVAIAFSKVCTSRARRMVTLARLLVALGAPPVGLARAWNALAKPIERRRKVAHRLPGPTDTVLKAWVTCVAQVDACARVATPRARV